MKVWRNKIGSENKDFLLTLYNLNYVEGQNVAQDQVKSKYDEEILALYQERRSGVDKLNQLFKV